VLTVCFSRCWSVLTLSIRTCSDGGAAGPALCPHDTRLDTRLFASACCLEPVCELTCTRPHSEYQAWPCSVVPEQRGWMRGCRVASWGSGAWGRWGPIGAVRARSCATGLRACARSAQRRRGGSACVPTYSTVCQHSIWAGCSNTCFELLLLLVAIPFCRSTVGSATLL
jgi:hypothetical protein